MYILRSLGVLALAKVMAAIYGALALIMLPIFLLVGVITAISGKQDQAIGGAVMVVLAILLPVFYAGMGFAFGAVTALLYNLFAKWVGGIEMELVAAAPVPAAAPPTPVPAS